MKKTIIIIIAMVLYFTVIILSREYSENHIVSFLVGISNALVVAFFVYLITNKKSYLKRK